MYILISITGNDYRRPSKVSKYKNKLESYLKDNGFYYSKKWDRYINDKNGGGGIDYEIKYIEEIT